MKPKNERAGEGVSAPAGPEQIALLELVSDNTKPSDTRDAITKRWVIASTDSTRLWRQVAANATWSECKAHGPVTKPRLIKVRFRNDTLHVRALCPMCSAGLGFVPQQKNYLTGTLEEKRAAFLKFRDEARIKNHKPGQAFYRYKADYGIDPDPAWSSEQNGGAK